MDLLKRYWDYEMSKLEKYSDYKDSGVEWLGSIPNGWEVRKLKFLGKIFAGLSDKKGDDFSKEYDSSKKEFIPFTNICNNVKIDKNQVQYVNIKNNEKQNRLEKNDIIFLMSSETLDDIGKCSIFLNNGEFYLNSFCKGYRLFSEDVYPEYVNYLLQSKSYRVYFSIVGRGFTRINIKQEYINDVFSIIPSKQEQQKIASFLDTKTQQLDKVIKQKETLINLLKERRQIIINDAVTKGIDKTVTMKDSGVEWIGEIPEVWEVKKLKYLVTKIGSGVTPSGGALGYLSDGIPLLRSQNILFEKINYESAVYISNKTHNKMKNSQVKFNDVLLNITGGSIGRCNFVNIHKDLNVNQHVCIIRPNKTINTVLLNNILASEVGQTQIWSSQQGGGREGLNFEAIKSFNFPTPPFQEQQKIVTFIENQTSKIDNAINLQQQQIVKLKEYKTTLIDSVVTGKVRVYDE
jgi:type I restriction enzyme S subunit